MAPQFVDMAQQKEKAVPKTGELGEFDCASVGISSSQAELDATKRTFCGCEGQLCLVVYDDTVQTG